MVPINADRVGTAERVVEVQPVGSEENWSFHVWPVEGEFYHPLGPSRTTSAQQTKRLSCFLRQS